MLGAIAFRGARAAGGVAAGPARAAGGGRAAHASWSSPPGSGRWDCWPTRIGGTLMCRPTRSTRCRRCCCAGRRKPSSAASAGWRIGGSCACCPRPPVRRGHGRTPPVPAGTRRCRAGPIRRAPGRFRRVQAGRGTVRAAGRGRRGRAAGAGHADKVPNGPDFLAGMMNLRGRALPVIDASRRFGAPGGGQRPRRRPGRPPRDRDHGGLACRPGSPSMRCRTCCGCPSRRCRPAPDLTGGLPPLFDRVAVGHGRADDPAAVGGGAARPGRAGYPRRPPAPAAA